MIKKGATYALNNGVLTMPVLAVRIVRIVKKFHNLQKNRAIPLTNAFFEVIM